MNLSANGLEKIKILEAGINPKKYLTAYWDYKRYAIGYGTSIYPNGQPVKKGDTITLEKANEMLKHQLKTFEKAVNQGVKVKINQNQFDSLVSFSFNVGTGAFLSSTLLKVINRNGTNSEIYKEFVKWKNAGGKFLDGLLKRRIQEYNMFTGNGSLTSNVSTFATVIILLGASLFLLK